MVGPENIQTNSLMIKDLEAQLKDLIDLNNRNNQSNAVAQSKLQQNIQMIQSVLEECPALKEIIDVKHLEDREYTRGLEVTIERLIMDKREELVKNIDLLSRGLRE